MIRHSTDATRLPTGRSLHPRGAPTGRAFSPSPAMPDLSEGGQARSPPARGRIKGADRDAMIVAHIPLVRMIASRICRRLPSHVESEELTSVGLLGLIDAVDRFDAARGTPFKAYAEIRVRGAIIDSLRQSDWVPLVVRRKRARIERTREALREGNKCEPGRLEMATALGISPEAYDSLLGSATVQKLVSLDDHDGSDHGGPIADRIGNGSPDLLDHWVQAEAQRALSRAMQQLPHMERQVLQLYYADGLKYREIGGLLGVCESRVCQLRGQAIDRLRRAVAVAAD